ncbi:MAG TPA: MSHA biogenesis protein MshE [Coxiellaceae bacterium]|nr:MSHA biogenesis protein MshE [Coxiellaceae bacterium]HBY55200.1 MSHA biogenesis protein MshE [Coxiellaceae bacterium]
MITNNSLDPILARKNTSDDISQIGPKISPTSNGRANEAPQKSSDEEIILQNLSKKINLPYVDITQYVLDENVSRRLPEKYARRFSSILLAEKNEHYLIGMVDPLDIFATDELHAILKKPLQLALVSETELLYKLDQLYRRTHEITDFADKLASELQHDTPENKEEEKAIKQVEPAVTKLLNSVFEDAVQVNASDIHIEPGENILRIRLRVDGLLQEQIISTADKRHIALAVAQRLKLMGGLSISEKRLPQDGRFEVVVRDIKFEVRMSTMPTQFGESVVMRLLNKSTKILNLETVGMNPETLKRFRQIIKIPYGMILVTGPTGSGKTTTLYGALTEISDVTKNIVTIEDPIEYVIERANQVQVNTQIGLTFARVLRSVLRQDPNVILVGEIRDQETASIALRSALTGHLVFATLHTNDAASTAIRLIDIGVENYLVAATIRAIIAQRLARRICDSCTAPHQPTEQEINFFTPLFGDSFKKSTFSYGPGCAHCNFIGYKGRVGVFELLELDGPMREALCHKNTQDFTQTVAKNRTTPTLLASAFEMAKQKITTLGEVMRIAGEQI